MRNTGDVVSYRDAQGFRKKDNRKLTVKLIDAYIYHYGWVKPIEKMRSKVGYFHRFWSSDEEVEKTRKEAVAFAYENHADSLALFTDTHPAVMKARIEQSNWPFTFDTTQKSKLLKVRLLDSIEKFTGLRIGEYRNYKILP